MILLALDLAYWWNAFLDLFTSRGIVDGLLAAVVFSCICWLLFRMPKKARELAESMAKSKVKKRQLFFLECLIRAVNREDKMSDSMLLTNFSILFVSCLFWFSAFAHLDIRLSIIRREMDRRIQEIEEIEDPHKLLEELAAYGLSLEEDSNKLDGILSILAPFGYYCLLFVAAMLFILLLWLIFVWARKRTIVAYLASLQSRYMDRMMAIATKDEARELAVLELRVDGEEALRSFLTRLHELSVKYDFPLDTLLIEYAKPRSEG